MIGVHSGFSSYSSYGFHVSSAPVHGLSPAAPVISRRVSHPETPVQPVQAAPPVTVEASGNVDFVRRGADPAELAVRMRIQHAET